MNPSYIKYHKILEFMYILIIIIRIHTCKIILIMYVITYRDICYKLIYSDVIVLINNRCHVKDLTVIEITTEIFSGYKVNRSHI